jgi:predicted permease
VTGPDFHLVRNASLGSPEGAEAYITFPFVLGEVNVNNGSFAGLVRAHPGASPQQVAAAVTAVGHALDEKYYRGRGMKIWPIGLKEDLVGPMRPALLVLAFSGAFLVLVLAVNLATLLLARAMQREREFAVSRALGANGGALVRATLFEAGLLGALGGAAASLIAIWGTRTLVAIAPLDLPRRESIVVDWSIAATIVGIGALLGLAAGIAPAAWASRSSLGTLLRASAVRGGGGRGRLRRILVVVQVALCLVLLSAGGLVARSFERLLRSQPGFDPHGVLTVRVPVSQWRYATNEDAVALHDRLERQLKALPGVTAVGAVSALPLSASADQWTVTLPGAPGNTGVKEKDEPLVDVIRARAGWPQALGVRILAGRDFGPIRSGAARETLIDRTLMRQFYPNGDAVGQILRANGDTLRIVGVVDHARQYDLHEDGRPQMYLRDQDDTYGTLYFALRSRRDPEDLIPDVRAVVRRLDPQLALSEMRALEDVVAESVRQQRTSAMLVGGFSLGALLLAAVGLFGVVAGSVTSRRQEIAVRLALGAEHGRAVRQQVREGAALVALGVVIGVPGVWLTGRLLRGVLIGISPTDPATLLAVAAGLGAVALAACWIPARRVTRIDPANVLREQ